LHDFIAYGVAFLAGIAGHLQKDVKDALRQLQAFRTALSENILKITGGDDA